MFVGNIYHTLIGLLSLYIFFVQCPGFKLNSEGKPDKGEPFADEAKFFVETRLLQRDVEIILESVNNNNFVGSIIHPVSRLHFNTFIFMVKRLNSILL